MATWAEVEVGDTVLAANGTEWVIDAVRNKDKGKSRAVTMSRGDKTFSKDMPSGGDVTVHSKGAPKIDGVDPTDLALAVVQSRLGGQVILQSDPANDAGIPKCPAEFTHPGGYLAHLYTMHGVQKPKLDSEHVHAEPGPGYLDHTHDLS